MCCPTKDHRWKLIIKIEAFFCLFKRVTFPVDLKFDRSNFDESPNLRNRKLVTKSS